MPALNYYSSGARKSTVPNDFNARSFGATKFLKFRQGGTNYEFGLTTKTNAKAYCGLEFDVNSQINYIGRTDSVVHENHYTHISETKYDSINGNRYSNWDSTIQESSTISDPDSGYTRYSISVGDVYVSSTASASYAYETRTTAYYTRSSTYSTLTRESTYSTLTRSSTYSTLTRASTSAYTGSINGYVSYLSEASRTTNMSTIRGSKAVTIASTKRSVTTVNSHYITSSRNYWSYTEVSVNTTNSAANSTAITTATREASTSITTAYKNATANADSGVGEYFNTTEKVTNYNTWTAGATTSGSTAGALSTTGTTANEYFGVQEAWFTGTYGRRTVKASSYQTEKLTYKTATHASLTRTRYVRRSRTATYWLTNAASAFGATTGAKTRSSASGYLTTSSISGYLTTSSASGYLTRSSTYAYDTSRYLTGSTYQKYEANKHVATVSEHNF